MIETKIPTDIIQLITTQQAWHYMILPFEKNGSKLTCYIEASRINPNLAEELEVIIGQEVTLVSMEVEALKKTIAQYYRKPSDARIQTQGVDLKIESSKDFVQTLIAEAKQLGSSDIHIEPFEKKCKLRMRIDGKLVERYVLEKETYPALVNKIKIQSNLDIAEKRLPQDGRIFLQSKKTGKLDVRVSILPTLHGEKIVLRLLGSDAEDIKLESLGFNDSEMHHYLEGIKRPYGIVLISGPTGSGKTTTLYATLQILNKPTANILTIEDPIEYTLEGINQVQLRESIGLDFPSAMRTFLRQDPDVIMVGEIRDKATASMAIKASLTGHLVLSTVHTNSAWGIVARLIDMGIPSYLLADTLNTAVAQRLVRLLCEHCKEQAPFKEDLFPNTYKSKETIDTHYIAKGCDHCHYSGYKGRKAVYEVIPINTQLAHLIKNKELNLPALPDVRSLSENAMALFTSGQTSIEEIYPMLASS